MIFSHPDVLAPGAGSMSTSFLADVSDAIGPLVEEALKRSPLAAIARLKAAKGESANAFGGLEASPKGDL